MLFAFFTSCLVTSATGAVECTNSYTEMTSTMRKGDNCEVVAARLHEGAINSVLIVKPRAIAVAVRSGCGTLAEVRQEATAAHLSYVANGIPSQLFAF